MAVLTSTHNLRFEQKYENYQNVSSESFQFLVVKLSIYLNRRVFVMKLKLFLWNYMCIETNLCSIILAVNDPIVICNRLQLNFSDKNTDSSYSMGDLN